MRVEIQGDYGVAVGPFDLTQRDALADLPDGQWPSANGVRFRTSAANVARLRLLGDAVAWRDPAGRLAEIDAVMALQADGRHREPGPADAVYGFRTTPFRHQLRSFAFARFLPAFALFCDPGTGKTKMLLDIAAAKFEAEDIDCLLIVAPNGVHRQWLTKQLPLHLPEIEYEAQIYSRSKRRMARVMAVDPFRLRILSVNVEALSTSGQTLKDVQAFVASGRCLLAVDESTRIKNIRATRTKNVLMLGAHAAQRAIMTGTPITKNILDLYSQFQFLNPDILGFRSFVKFRERYCIVEPAYRGAAMGVVKVVGTRNVGELMGKIAPYTFRALKSECLDLPDKVYEQREVSLTDEQARHYNEMVEDFRTRLGEGSLTALNAAARVVRLQQILSGFIPRNDDNAEAGELEVLTQNRTRALLDYIEDIGDRQLVVWVRFQRDADNIANALSEAGVSHVVCDGRVSPGEREARKARFMAGEVQVYVGNPAAVGTGTDGLQVAGLAVFYSHTFDAERRWQAEDRTHRQGLEHDSMTYIEFVCPGTVDELFLSNNADKRELVDRLMANPSLLTRVEA